LQGLAPLSFGDIIGGNVIDLTLIMAIVVFFTRKGVSTDSKMVQGSSWFTFLIAILPIFLIWNGQVTRIDGVILLAAFFIYMYWLFSKDGRYAKVYQQPSKPVRSATGAKLGFVKNLVKLVVLVAVLLVASHGVITSAQYFSRSLGVSLSLVGVLIVALGNCFPEMYFGVIAGRRNEGWMIIGDMMGSVITAATLVLGIIAIISPFQIPDMTPFLIARVFTVIAAIFFLFFTRSDKKLTKREALLLLFIYIAFLLSEIFLRP